MYAPYARTVSGFIVSALLGTAIVGGIPAVATAQTPGDEVRRLAEHPAVQNAFRII